MQSVINNGFIICFGHHYWNLTLGGYQSAQVTLNLPVTYQASYKLFVCARNQAETIATGIQPNNSTFTLVAFNNSADSRYTYGIWWLTVGG